jgi:hypothetical protein
MQYNTTLQARFYDDAERLYVEQGLSPKAIHNRFAGEGGEQEAPSRRTIYNWKEDGDWEAARRRWLKETEDIEANLQEAIRAATKNAIENPNRDTFSALRNAISGAKMYKQMQGIEQGIGDAEDDRDEGEVARDALEVVKQALEGG